MALKEVLDGLAVREAFRPLARYRVFQVWPQAVGRELARRTRPVSFNGRTLVVAAADHAWAAELVYLKETVLNILRRDLGVEGVEDIVVEVGHLPEAVYEDEGELPRPSFPSPGRPPDFQSIADAELRQALMRLWRRAQEGSGGCSYTSAAT